MIFVAGGLLIIVVEYINNYKVGVVGFVMFTLPREVVAGIISGEVDYNLISGDSGNEGMKGFLFEDQARVNAMLERNHIPQCAVSEKDCLKNDCTLYKDGQIGKLDFGWVCREYKVNFPDASFDSRRVRWRVGTDKIDFVASLENVQALEKQGARHHCLGCNRLYNQKPKEWYEDGHGGRFLEMCGCGSDLFDDIGGLLERLSGTLSEDS